MKRWLALAALLCPPARLDRKSSNRSPPFRGQTEAPAPKQASKYRTETITDKLTGPWALAFLPDGNFLVTERRGNLRTVTPKGEVSEPIAGVPPVKGRRRAELPRRRARSEFRAEPLRLLHLLRAAEGRGREGVADRALSTTTSGTRRSPSAGCSNLGAERVARAQALRRQSPARGRRGADRRRVERRIVFARDGTMYVTGADAFRFYDSDLDGIERRRSPHEPDVRRNFTGRVIRINSDGIDPEGQPVARPRDRVARDVRARLQGSRRRGAASDDRRALARRPRPAGRRRDQHRARRARLRLARGVVRRAVRRAPSRRPQERRRRQRARPR